MKAALAFRRVGDRDTDAVHPSRPVSRLVNDLLESGIRICTLGESLHFNLDNVVAINFDEGMQSGYHYALPMLRAAGVPSRLYLTTGVRARV